MIAAAINLLGRPWNGLTGSAGSAPSSPSGNGLLVQLKGYWSFDSYTGSSSPASAGGISIFNNGGGGGFIGNGLINGGCDAPICGDSGVGFYTSGVTNLSFTNDFSISVWVNPNDGSGQTAVVGNVFHMSNNASTAEHVSVGLNSDAEQIWYGINNNSDGNQVYTQNFGWNAGVWIHLVLTYNFTDSILSLYVNGQASNSFYVSQFSSSSPVTEIDVLTDFVVQPLAFGSMSAKADEVGVWQKELTPSQISALYNGGAGKAFSTFTA